MTNPNWQEPIDRLKARVVKLQKKTDDIDNIIPEIEKDLEVIEKGLNASKEMIEAEAEHNPKIQTSLEELDKEVGKLETKIATLQTNQENLKKRTVGIAGISLSIGAIGGIAIWAGLNSFKNWIDTRTPVNGTDT